MGEHALSVFSERSEGSAIKHPWGASPCKWQIKRAEGRSQMNGKKKTKNV